MATTTVAVTVAAGANFSVLADGAAYKTVGIQCGEDSKALLIYVGLSASPPSGSTDNWILLWRDTDNDKSVTIDLSATDSVWAKSIDGTATKARLLRISA